MACVVENAQLFCNTADVGFGPVCESDDEAIDLLNYVWKKREKDPRAVSIDDLHADLAEMRKEKADAKLV